MPFEKSAAFMIGREMRFIDTNDAARATLGIRKGAPLSDLPVNAEDLEALREKLGLMLMKNSDETAIFRARMCGENRVIVLHLRSLHPKDGAPVVIAVTTELKWPVRLDETLRAAFGLTQAETDIIRALTECKSLRDIAKARGRSIETVRAQMRSILSKTETRSQTELVRLTLSMMEITSYTEDHAARATPMSEGYDRLSPRPYHQITQADGRIMEYLLLGAKGGRPILYMPLDYGLTRWPASAEARLEREGLMAIVPIRAGYGNSTPLPKKALGVSRCPAISLGSDIYYLAHLHRLDRKRLSAIIACAGTCPLTRSEQYERMGKWHRFILASARYTPHLLPFMVKAGFSLARRLRQARLRECRLRRLAGRCRNLLRSRGVRGHGLRLRGVPFGETQRPQGICPRGPRAGNHGLDRPSRGFRGAGAAHLHERPARSPGAAREPARIHA